MSDLFWQMNDASNENKGTAEKHVPVVKLGERKGNVQEVIVDVGEGKHPNENAHHIQWIELLGNDLFIARADISPVIADSVVKFYVKAPGQTVKLTAIARCNLHGVWKSNIVELK